MGDNTANVYGRKKASDEAYPVDDNASQQIFDNDASSVEPNSGKRGQVTSRLSRENILRSYASQDAERARNARMYSQSVSQAYRENATRASERAAKRAAIDAEQREQDTLRAAERRRNADAQRAAQQSSSSYESTAAATPRATRVVPPLSSQESYDRTRSSMESYERARASRDALSDERRSRTPNREVIDGRGSIDSRAFNERNELVGYSIDDRDKPQASVDSSYSDTRWHSRAGQGFGNDAARESGSPRRASSDAQRFRAMEGGSASTMGMQRGTFSSVPLFVKIAVPVIVVLVIVLIVVLVR